tara:strand:+ start:7 stop:456 length:450 start_codon:yes stop_codon:yes gene_type:complete
MKKTMHELAKEFPDKTYRQLEKYRSDMDELELIKGEIQKREQEELKPIQREIRWREKYNLEHRLRQEAEGELTIIKGIGNSSPEMKLLKSEVEALKTQLHTDRVKANTRCDHLVLEMDRIKRENMNLYKRIAELTDPAVKAQKARESGL